VEKNILTVEELKAVLEHKGEADVILTGAALPDAVCVLADEVSRIETVKFKVWE
jgi:cob(I)alamin adenosyltransferase